ncbi:MAG: hypothetical protein KatS3mg057_1546 [Herpetosiphonaceae bacterium]|nr:MAG: hypothetical protein KatS3mg057_1546 [Herpetosiphonaceae bacterium]
MSSQGQREPSQQELIKRAKELNIEGYSTMNKEELMREIERVEQQGGRQRESGGQTRQKGERSRQDEE